MEEYLQQVHELTVITAIQVRLLDTGRTSHELLPRLSCRGLHVCFCVMSIVR